MLLKLVSFNMKRTSLPRNRHAFENRKEAIRAFFWEEKPDVVGTQELLYPYIKIANELLPQYGSVGEGRNGGNAGEYVAIFYAKEKFRLIDQGTFWLSKTPDKPASRSWLTLYPRTCTWALLESVEDGGRIRVYNTHLDCLSFLARLNGLRVITRHVAQNALPHENVVLMGDFNAPPNSRPLRSLCEIPNETTRLTADFTRVYNDQIGRTYHGFSGKTSGLPIDYILTSGDMDVVKTYVNHARYLNKYPSDHFPVVRIVRTQPQH